MNSAMVSRVLELIPERTVRVSTGTAFFPGGSGCEHPERMALVMRFLHWLGPLSALSKDEQRELGLLAGHARSAEVDAEADPDPDAEALEPEESLGEEEPVA